jgi:hypothetical protein
MSSKSGARLSARTGVAVCLVILCGQLAGAATGPTPEPPYPPSSVIKGLTWHWDTYQTAAIGSDLWPVTWGDDDNLYVAWGDGGGFGGTDSDGRVSMGFARIEGGPERFQAFNVNGGKNPEHPPSFPKKGKTAGLICEGGVLYTLINLQDGDWPNVNHVLAWSTNKGASWEKCAWLFPKGAGRFLPGRFVHFGKDGAGVPFALAGYIYVCGAKITTRNESLYLARVRREELREQKAYQFFSGINDQGVVEWSQEFALAQPFFTDRNGVAAGGMVYDPGLGRYLLTAYHEGPGQLGLFEAPQPWGPWSTAAYYSDWGGMGADGEGLTCEFPQKWMSSDGLTLWAIFSVYGGSAKKGINAHDRFNLIKVTLSAGIGSR